MTHPPPTVEAVPRKPGPPSTNKTFRIPDDLLAWMEAKAAADRRSLNQWLVVVMEDLMNAEREGNA